MTNKDSYKEKYGELLTVVKFRPVKQSIALTIVGIFLVLYFRNAFGYTIGGFMGVTGIVSLLSKDHKVGELYERGVVVFDEKGIEPIQDFPYDSVVEWNDGLDRENCFTFYLNDNTKSSFPCFQPGKPTKTLQKIMPERETKEMERQKAMKQRKNNKFFKLFSKKKKKQ